MPQNSYSNADLSRFRRTSARPDEMEVLQEIPREGANDYRNEPSVEALLAGARGSLDRANKFAAETGSDAIARIPQRLENIKGHAFEPMDAIDALDAASDLPMAASIIPGPQQVVTGAMAGLMKTPKALRSLIQGNYGDAAMEGAEAAFVGAPGPIFNAIGKGFRAAKGAAGNAITKLRQGSFPSRVHGGSASAEIPYAGVQQATNPNQALAVARDIAFENGDDLATTLNAGAKGGVNRQSAQALLRLAGSGAEGRGAQAVRAGQAAMQEAAPFRRAGIPQNAGLDPADFMGDRTTGQFVEGPGGLSDVAAGRIQRYPLPNDARYMSEVDSLTAGMADDLPEFSLVDDVADVAQVQPNARDVDMLAAGVNPAQEALQASMYARDTMKRKTPPPPKNPRPRGKSKKGSPASLRALQNAITPMADDVVNAAYQRAKE